ncbi:MAG: DUF4291 domain-containing protein [Myxococcota bacterium]
MRTDRLIRADFDRSTLVVYQAFHPSIADAALKAQHFVPPFSFGRMTWIKPSFLWLMERSDWGRRARQERTLAVRIHRSAWDDALREAVLTNFEAHIHASGSDWRTALDDARVRVQWDPERSIHGKKLDVRAIQVGLHRDITPLYAKDWIVGIEDYTPLVQKIRGHLENKQVARARALLPREAVYDVDPETRKRLGMAAP